MASAFKGLFVEIGADDTKFNKAISSVNKNITQTNKYLKTMDKQITESFDPNDLSNFEKAIKEIDGVLESLEKQTANVKKEMQQMEDAGNIDSREYNELLITLNKLETNTKAAENQQDKYNKTIKSIETGELDSLPNQYKKIASAAEDAGESSGGFADSLSEIDVGEIAGSLGEAAGATELFGKASQVATKLINPYTAAIAAATLGLKEYVSYKQDMREIGGIIETSVNQSSLSFEELEGNARKMSKTLGISVSEAAELSNEAIQDLGDNIQTTSDHFEGMYAALAINNTGLIDASEAYAAASSNTAAFGDGLAQANVTIGESIYMMQTYGTKADDIIDTQIEWSDTFAATGQSSQQMFDILNAGMVAGARNTDEIANAWNEFTLRIGAGSEGTIQAFDAMGLSYSDTVALFNEGSYSSQEAFLRVVEALFQVEDVTKRTALAAEIFGTQGEEMLAVMNITSEGAGLLADKMGTLKAIQEQVGITTQAGSEFWAKYAEANNLTAVQVADLQYKLETQGLAALDTSTKQAILGQSLIDMATNAGFSEIEISNLKNTMLLLSGNLDIAKISQEAFSDGLDSLYNAGILTESAMNTLNNAMVRFKDEGVSLTSEEVKGLNQNLSEMQTQGILTATQTQKMSNAVETLGSNSSSGKEKVSALSTIVTQLGKANELSKTQVSEMKDKVKELGDKSFTTDEKIDNLEYIIGELGGTTLLTQEKADSLKESLGNLQTAAENGSTAQDGLRGDVDEAGQAMDDERSAVDDLMGVYIASLGPLARHRAEVQLGEEKYNDLTGATDDSEEAQSGFIESLKNSINPLSATTGALGDLMEKSEDTTGKVEDTDEAVDGLNNTTGKPEVDTESIDSGHTAVDNLKNAWDFWTPGKKSLTTEVSQVDKGTYGPPSPNAQVSSFFTPNYRGASSANGSRSTTVTTGDIVIQGTSESNSNDIASQLDKKLYERINRW